MSIADLKQSATHDVPTPSLDDQAPELILAFVAPTGIEFDTFARETADRLAFYGYSVHRIRLSEFLAERRILSGDDARYLDQRIKRLQDEGNAFRFESQRGDILSFVAMNEIRKERERRWRLLPEDEYLANFREEGVTTEPLLGDQLARPGERPLPSIAYLVWSLKHPDEIATLRSVYRSRCVILAGYCPRPQRIEDLAARIAESRSAPGEGAKWVPSATWLIDRDERDAMEGVFPLGGRGFGADGNSEPTANRPAAERMLDPEQRAVREARLKFSQDVRDTYPLADFFINATTPYVLRATTRRAVDIIFGAPFETPTKDEYGMYFADAAALRSAELGRQVGAAIATSDGDIVGVGTNEVPSPRGGQYWREDGAIDRRQFRERVDESDHMRLELISQILSSLRPLFADQFSGLSVGEAASLLSQTRLSSLTEYGRAVHAEMSAITDAARRGVSTADKTMYVTTFPCHHCARHIVAAGIRRVVYIYPYPKSLARILHGDSIETEDSPPAGASTVRRVRFEPFRGVAPRWYRNAFEMSLRKDEDGKPLPLTDPERLPRLLVEETRTLEQVWDYILRETTAVAYMTDALATPSGGQTTTTE